jgi:hypothetical protein
MTVPIKGRNNLSFSPMQQLYALINEKVQDINASRRVQTTSRKKQWIYPSTPNANDENYPRIALIDDSIKLEDYGSGQYIRTEYTAGNADRMIFGRVAILPVTIGVFVKKKQPHEIELYDTTTKVLQGKMQSDFVGDKIAKLVEAWRSTYFIPYNMDIKVISVSGSYDNNTFSYAKNIEVEIVMMDEWEYDFTDQGYDEGIIANIDTTIVIQ